MLYYFASCFDLGRKKLAKLHKLQQRVVIGRPWIQGAKLAGVISVFKIGPTCNMNAAFQRAKVAMCLRFWGLKAILGASKKHPFINSANKILLQCHAAGPSDLDPLLSLSITSPEEAQGNKSIQRDNRKNVYKILKALKDIQKKEHHQVSYDYISAKARKSPIEAVTDVVSSGLLELLRHASPKTLNKVDRLYLLRWFAFEEADWNLQLRFQSISKRQICKMCSNNNSNLCPLGAAGVSICHHCYRGSFGSLPWLHFLPIAIRNQLKEDPNS
jgi:hypothetical protein